MKRILFFVHYNKYNSLSDYVVYLLQHIKHIYTRIVFVSNSPLSGEDISKLTEFYNDIIIRENKSFDFGAWKDAIMKEGWDELSKYDSITLMNDTCFGPLFDFEPYYINMEKQNIDFWGLTNNGGHRKRVFRNSLPEHIQSYFYCFNRNVVKSKVFQSFWNKMKYYNNVGEIIKKYEIPLTRILSKNGFIYSVVFNTMPFIKNKDIVAFSYPDIIIQNNVPFLKIKSFIYYSRPKYTIDMICERTEYPSELVQNYITEMFGPNISLKICNKLVPVKTIDKKSNTSFSIGVHFHISNLDLFQKYVNYFTDIKINYDLYITTNLSDKVNQIKLILENNKIIPKEIITENKENGILTWLNINDRLDKYDIVGHFHTDIDLTKNDYFDLLLKPIDEIIDIFNINNHIGIIVPQPYSFLYSYTSIYEENQTKEQLNILWNKMNCKKNIDFNSLKMIITCCGRMFWYRPKALEILFQFYQNSDCLKKLEIDNSTIVRCIEQIIIYLLWDSSFDYRIMVHAPQRIDDFLTVFDLLNDIKMSKTYRIGQFFLAIPKFIRKNILR